MKPDYNHVPQIGVHVARHRCQKALPRSQQMADSVVGVEVAGAYVRKAGCRRVESDSAPLNAGGRKSRRAGTRPRCATSVKLSSFAAAKKRCHAHSVCQTALQASKWQVRIC